MNYTDTAGNHATGIVWSPGPLPGTVWVLPRSGASASEARVVHVRKRTELSTLDVDARKVTATATLVHSSGGRYDVDPNRPAEVRAAHRQAFNEGRGLPAKDWHAALGFDPRERVPCFEANDQPTLLDLTA